MRSEERKRIANREAMVLCVYLVPFRFLSVANIYRDEIQKRAAILYTVLESGKGDELPMRLHHVDEDDSCKE